MMLAEEGEVLFVGCGGRGGTTAQVAVGSHHPDQFINLKHLERDLKHFE